MCGVLLLRAGGRRWRTDGEAGEATGHGFGYLSCTSPFCQTTEALTSVEECYMPSPGFHPKMARQCNHPWKSIIATRRRLKPSRRRPLSFSHSLSLSLSFSLSLSLSLSLFLARSMLAKPPSFSDSQSLQLPASTPERTQIPSGPETLLEPISWASSALFRRVERSRSRRWMLCGCTRAGCGQTSRGNLDMMMVSA